MEALQCEGLKGGDLYHINNGYFYAKNVKKNDNLFYLRCMVRRCKGAAKIVTTDGVRLLQELTAHSDGCQPQLQFIESLALRRNILVRCECERKSLSTIFQEECNRVSPIIAASLTMHQILTSMRNARRKGTPLIPHSYVQYEELLVGRFGENGIDYTFKKVGADEDEAVVFIVDPLRNLFKGSEEIHFDGTFKIVPNVPQSRQLLTALAISNDHAFPVAFALMRSKSAEAYKNVFRCFRQNCADLKPKLIISDFERSIKSAVQEIFPEAIHKGCWFHFTQAIFKRVQRSGHLQAYHNNPVVKRSVRMLMCLALLPEHLVEEGFNAVELSCQEEVMEHMAELFTYFKSQWMEVVGSSSFSVYGQPRRTNNVLESFHHTLNGLIGKAHPNVWEFTGALSAVANTAVRDQLRMDSRGAQLTVGRRRRWVLQDATIHKAQENAVLGRITPFEFLSQMTHHVTSHVPLVTVHDDVDLDLAPLPDMMRVHSVPLETQDNLEDTHPATETSGRGRVRGRDSTRGGRGRGRGRGRNSGVVRTRGGRGGVMARGHDRIEELPMTAGNAAQDGHDTAGNDPITHGGPPLQSRYAAYRQVSTINNEDDFMKIEDISKQIVELKEDLDSANENSVETPDGYKCILCLLNRPTRVCLPCGHLTMCRDCMQVFIDTEQFHSVVMADGNVMVTHIRLPLICPLCRSIIGSMRRVVLPSLG